MIDDLWPDPAQLLDLPRSAAELPRFKREIRLKRAPGQVQPAWEGTVPKRDGLTRTGHQIAPKERIYFQALVDSFLHAVDPRLDSPGHVFGYRPRAPRSSERPFGKNPIAQWLDFHHAVQEVARAKSYEAVVVTDIAAFFEQISHVRLEEQLVQLGVAPPIARELRTLLDGLMKGKSRGIPQGNDASSVVASIYLASVDRAMLSAGYAYYRYVDDIRIFAASEGQARRILRQLEAKVRTLELTLQPGKTRILVGAAQIKAEIIDADAEVDGIDYHWRSRPRRLALPLVRKTWRSVSRRKAWDKRLVKFLVNRLRKGSDDFAVNWCLDRLGTLDWLAELVAPYLALFVDQKRVQLGVENHLRSEGSESAWEAVALLRMCLTAPKVRRGILDYAAMRVGDRNENPALRAWAAVLLGKAGDAADRAMLRPYMLDDVMVARGMVVALQADRSLRGTAYAEIAARYPELRPLIGRYKGHAREVWPIFPKW
jgi:hypothetical protein